MADPQQQQGGKPGAMADLDAALGLTEAWLQGDSDVARWAADDGDASPPARGGGAWPSLDAELDAAALAREDAELDALVLGAGPAVAAGGGALGGPSFDPFGSLPLGSDPAGLSGGSDGSQDGEGDVGAIPDLAAGRAGGGAAAGNPAAAAAAEEARRGVEGIELMEDIDAEPGDTMAPGAGPLSLEAALGQGLAGMAQPEPPAPPIVPAPTDMAATEADPLAALAAAVESDKPKFSPSPEWVQMMKAVNGELQEAPDGSGQPTLVDAPRPAASSGPTGPSASHSTEVRQQLPAADAEMAAADDEGQASAGAAGLPPLPPPGAPEPPATEADRERKETFALLQPICSVLLLQRGEPARMAELLAALASALEDAPLGGLRQCQDYVLFPLMMMADAIVATRQRGGSAGSGGGGKPVASGPAGDDVAAAALMALPAMASDQAAEAALGCVLRVLRRCPLQSGDGLLGLLRRLAFLLDLPPGAASEEIREAALRCLEAAAGGVARRGSPPGVREALLVEAAAPLLGYTVSLPLQIAEAEAQKGGSGSKAIRDAALQAVLGLLTAVTGPAAGPAAAAEADTAPGTPAVLPAEAAAAAEALAFFLPGVAVGLCKALLLAASSSSGGTGGGRAATGPAASSAAAVTALQALVTLLVACLGDAAVEPALHSTAAGESSESGGAAAWQGAGAGEPGGSENLQRALQQLQELAQRAKSGAAAPAAAAQPGQPEQQQQQQRTQQPGRMRVERSAEWVQDSAERLHQLLSTALPPLLAHQRAAVRQALVASCCRLLDSCSMALQPRTQEALLQLLLSAAQDEWQEVSAPARAWLQAQAAAAGSRAGDAEGSRPAAAAAAGPGGGSNAFAAASERLLLQLIEGLPGALRRGDVAGRQHAQQLTSAIQVCPPAWFAANVAQHPLRLQQLLSAFLEGLAFEPSIAGMLLYSAAAPAGAATSYTPGGGGGSHSGAELGGQQQQQQQAAAGTEQQEQGLQQLASDGAASAALLPRMPLGLALIATAKTYEAVAAALRAAAALAAAADAAPGSSGTALRSLVDACLSRLQQLTDAAASASGADRAHKRSRQQPAAGSESGGSTQAAAAAAAGQPPWQLQAASVAAVLAELLFGASPAWQPSWRMVRPPAEAATGGAAAAGGDSGGAAAAVSSSELEALAAAAVQELVGDPIWSLPTALAADGSAALGSGSGAPAPLLLEAAAGPGQRLSAQQLGCNALLQKAALECCGTAARALGPRFAQNGRLLRAALLPLLEKLADPAQLVSAAAQAAVACVCRWCGYGGSLRRLVAANADYLVDGMCRQLRQLDAHPRAPQLFTALLQQAGVAPELLPLLAEPARGAVGGLGILARRQQPQHVLAFLQALLPMAAAAGAVARQALAEMRAAAAAVRERWEARQRELQEQEAAALAAAGGDAAAASQAEVRAFFARQQRRRAAREQPGVPLEAAEGHPQDELELEEAERQVPLSAPEREHIALLRRHAHAAGGLAQAVADAASPLFVAQGLAVAVQSFGVVSEALRALAATTEAVELDGDQIQQMSQRPLGVTPPDPETPRLLPSVHLAWVPLMGALQDWRVAVVEGALQFLADIACLSGSFLRKRFGQEAAPALRRLLAEGPARRNVIAPGQDDTTSPATVQRVQLAVLRCLQQIAASNTPLAIAGISSSAAEALLPAAGPLLAAVGDAMGARQPAPVREQATQAYVALARVDPDAAWCQLSAALQAAGGGEAGSSAQQQQPQQQQQQQPWEQPRVPPGITLPGTGEPLSFPSLQQIAPPLPAADTPAAAGRRRGAAAAAPGLCVPPGLREAGAAKLAAMLRQVEALPPRWHRQAEQLLERP